MADIKLNWAFNLTIDGKLNIPVAPPEVAVTAYDVIRVDVPAATDPPPGSAPGTPLVPATASVDVQPSTAADRVLAFLVTADKYDAKLSFAVPAGTGTKAVALDGPQLFLGAGMVSALANPFPQKVTFTNTKKEPFAVTLFVGRRA